MKKFYSIYVIHVHRTIYRRAQTFYFSQVKNITITAHKDSNFEKNVERMLVISKIYDVYLYI